MYKKKENFICCGGIELVYYKYSASYTQSRLEKLSSIQLDVN